ncbi:WxL domain-containing protein [Vagococcus sp. BWB3-3]|uniref:WxL domain-containing protein n=1 Tax=Vagococcus allomyrinae TaxID=2794353 RepID=A0A940PK08_9ENTE|nr:WxL domain-containing protein [Vagococcus allomyrinae]MBP1044288.1 WxL domain-containing protein [Vagococcus allomyrinae]
MKLTNKLLGAALFSIVLGGQAVQVSAATYNNATNADSDAVVEFIENQGPGEIIDPLDPEVPVDPENPVNPNPGALRINYVSDFDFGQIEQSGSAKHSFAALDSVANAGTTDFREVPNFVSVQDDRGSNAGWRLTVSQSEQLTAVDADGTHVLDSAKITLKNAQNANTASPFQPTTINTDIEMTIDGDTKDVAIADEGKGMSTWSIGFGDSNAVATESIRLDVPGETKKVKGVQYKTQLNWNLASTPL